MSSAQLKSLDIVSGLIGTNESITMDMDDDVSQNDVNGASRFTIVFEQTQTPPQNVLVLGMRDRPGPAAITDYSSEIRIAHVNVFRVREI